MVPDGATLSSPETPRTVARAERVRAGARWGGRLLVLLCGLLCFALGIVMTLHARVGLGPWDVFHQGLSQRVGISFGQANLVVGFFILLLAWALGARPGLGSVLNMLLVGAFVDLIVRLGVVPDLAGRAWPPRLLLDLAGVAVVGIGTAFYIRANFGAGPRDGLMLVLARRVGDRVSVVRGALELAALAVGIVLGGSAGPGTLIFALGIGPAVGLAFRLFGVQVKR